MPQTYSKSRIPEPEGWHVTANTIWAMLCFALLLTGYFFGLHKGSSLEAFMNRRGPAPAQADNTLPIAPSAGGIPSAAPASGDLLARAQLENELLYTDLQSFICSEQIERYRGRLDGQSPHRIDTITAKVSFENGTESYTDVLQNNHPRPALSSVSGAWSEGEFGTLLRQTRALLSSQPMGVQPADLNGQAAAVYTFEVAGNDSPWELTLISKQYRVPFRTQVWVSKSSGQIMKITRTSTAMPSGCGISEIEWGVVLQPVNMDGKEYLLPSSGEYSVLYEHSNHREWNVINFSDYHRYTSRSIIHF